jgi:hypothetical protein
MADELLERIRALAAASGFGLDAQYCDDRLMIHAIREVEGLAEGQPLSPEQGLALRENLRRVLLRTSLAPSPGRSLAAQALRRRWIFLRTEDAAAADAYVAVLRLFELEVPKCLLPGPP